MWLYSCDYCYVHPFQNSINMKECVPVFYQDFLASFPQIDLSIDIEIQMIDI